VILLVIGTSLAALYYTGKLNISSAVKSAK